MSKLPVTSVEYTCPKCWRTLKPPVRSIEAITWVEGTVRHYAHARCFAPAEEGEGVDSSDKMVTDQTASS